MSRVSDSEARGTQPFINRNVRPFTAEDFTAEAFTAEAVTGAADEAAGVGVGGDEQHEQAKMRGGGLGVGLGAVREEPMPQHVDA